MGVEYLIYKSLLNWRCLPNETAEVLNLQHKELVINPTFVFWLGNNCRWESGYWNTMDIAHDRAGYYLCWGCLNWVPAIYTSQPLFLASNPYQLHPFLALVIFVAGAASIYINWDCDRQRQVLGLYLISTATFDMLPSFLLCSRAFAF